MTKKLHIKYDDTLKIMTVSPSAWTATGPTQWFSNYRIISTIDNPLADRLGLISIKDFFQPTEKTRWTTKEILESNEYGSFLADSGLSDHRQLVNRATKFKFPNRALTNDYAVTSNFENKVWLRQAFSDVLRFPPFTIISYLTLTSVPAATAYEQLTTSLQTRELIIQHQSLSGGRGTYSVSSPAELAQCLESLSSEFEDAGRDERLVVSVRLRAIKERTLQMCVTADAIYVGPPQAQLIGHPLLTSNRPGDIQFCGGRIEPGLLSDSHYASASQSARMVGEALREKGYRGIFGMDFIVSNDEIYPIEVNPRMTGMTTLLAFLQVELPFLLLHILELADSAYEVMHSVDVDKDIAGSFIVVHALGEGVSDMRTGTYDSSARRINDGWESGSILPSDEAHYFVAMRSSPGKRAQKGKSLAFIYSRTQLFDDNGILDEQVLEVVKRVQSLT